MRPCEAVRGRVRPWEAVLLSLAQTDLIRSQSQSGEHGLTQPLTASQIRPHTASHGLSSPRPHRICHVICLSQSGEHGLSRIGLYRAMQSDPRGRLTDFTAKRIASPGVRLAGVRERPIGLSNLWGRGSLTMASHHKVMWSVWESEHGLSRPHR